MQLYPDTAHPQILSVAGGEEYPGIRFTEVELGSSSEPEVMGELTSAGRDLVSTPAITMGSTGMASRLTAHPFRLTPRFPEFSVARIRGTTELLQGFSGKVYMDMGMEGSDMEDTDMEVQEWAWVSVATAIDLPRRGRFRTLIMSLRVN